MDEILDRIVSGKISPYFANHIDMFSKIKSYLAKGSYYLSKSKRRKFNKTVGISEMDSLCPTLNLKYRYFHHYFWNRTPDWLKDHRSYFAQENRGFGEDAFHAMWYRIFQEYKPGKILEIGVYRGQTLSLFSLLGEKMRIKTDIHGISPFTAAGDDVSKYLELTDYYEDVLKNFEHFHLSPPVLHKGFSTDPAMVQIINSQKWDLIYIDGSHDYDVVKADFAACSQNIKTGGLIVLDDASLYSDFKPPFYASPGHPGPSRVAGEINPDEFEEILGVVHNRVFKKL